MKNFCLVMSIVMVSMAIIAGVSYSSEVYNFVGTIMEFDRAKGEMHLIEIKDDDGGQPARKITITDNERHILKRNKELKYGVRLNVDYEIIGNANMVRKYKIIPGGC